MLHETHLNWLRQLIACRSVTPNDDNAQHLICKIVKKIFPELQLQIQTAHSETTHNTSVIINGTSKKLTFAGHTDVVPADQGDWQSDPFQLTARENRCFGRGIVDMKGAIICFLAALDNLRQKNIPLPTVQIILTSDEEGSGQRTTTYLRKNFFF